MAAKSDMNVLIFGATGRTEVAFDFEFGLQTVFQFVARFPRHLM